MPFVINPDGTVDVLEVEYDSYGNMRPKRTHDSNTPSFKSVSSIKSKLSAGFTSKKKKKKNKKNVVTSSSVIPTESNNDVKVSVPSNNDSSNIGDKSLVKKVRIITRQSVEKFFLRKKSLRQIITNEELERAKLLLKGLLLELFMQRYEQYKEYCLKIGWGPKIPIISKKKKNNKKKKHIAETVIQRGNTSGNTIGAIAKFSSVKDSLADADVKYNKTGPSRPPKFGYARDYFGRVQERDSYNDDKKNEFKHAERSQSRYDYSSYDAEDDHDSYYDSGGYD